jgi:hypothetical protein
MCASGPFSSANSVSHQQLDCLLEQVTALNPDVLLLVSIGQDFIKTTRSSNICVEWTFCR